MSGKIKLFCLPHAGASASIYYKWQKNIDNALIDVIPIEYKGHGTRLDEIYYHDFTELIEEIFNIVNRELGNNDKYMIFGHSMGAYVGFELENMLERKKGKRAEHIILSGREAPCFWGLSDKKISTMGDAEFVKEISSYGGIEQQYLEEKEIISIILPIIRNDFRIIESKSVTDVNIELKTPITIMNGRQDKCQPEHVRCWGKYSTASCTIKYFNGGHFYINENIAEICDYINLCAQKPAKKIVSF